MTSNMDLNMSIISIVNLSNITIPPEVDLMSYSSAPDVVLEVDLSNEHFDQWVSMDTFIGLILALSSCIFIGLSVIIKKLALNDIEDDGGTRAVDGGFGYLLLPRWWLGISLMGLGELANFVAYIFAPAILVTPLGVFSIVVTAVLSPYFLPERLNKLGRLGCGLVIVGCVIVTLCGPKDREIGSMEELQEQLLHPGFLIYASIVVSVSVVLMILVPRYGHRYVLLYITICSSFGSLSVMFCKGVGLAIKQSIVASNAFTNWATWVCLAALVSSMIIETIYMQKALDVFNSSLFMSVIYVMFTSLVIVASSILYTELADIGWVNIVLTILGFIVNIAALYLLYIDKSYFSKQEMQNNNNKSETVTKNDNENPTSMGAEKTCTGSYNSPHESPKEQHISLLDESGIRTPASPLANISLRSGMFTGKSNSCKSVLSNACSEISPCQDGDTKGHNWSLSRSSNNDHLPPIEHLTSEKEPTSQHTNNGGGGVVDQVEEVEVIIK